MHLRTPYALLAAGMLACLSGAASAKVFYARDEVRTLAFPDSTRMEPRDFFLSGEQRTEIEHLAKSRLGSDLFTVYVGYRGDILVGYAIVDTHVVRTLPETFLVVLTPEGRVAATHVLAFYEPLEYLPTDRWLAQFEGRRLSPNLKSGRGIAGITGSTLTAEAVNGGVRRALAIYDVLLEGK